MIETNVCIFKGIQDAAKYLTYLLDENKHKGQLIIHNNVLEKVELMEKISIEWKQAQSSKKGHKPKPLSLVLSFPAGTTKETFIPKALSKVHAWFKTISRMDKLGLDDDAIEVFVRNIPYVAHYKNSNPHIHFLIPKILPYNDGAGIQTLRYINLYRYRYSNPMYQISGWSIKDKVTDQHYKNKQKVNSSEQYLKDKLYDEIDKYKNLNAKLDKYIQRVESDIKKGHFDKAQKKINNIKGKNNVK